jgi:hypothetical protein
MGEKEKIHKSAMGWTKKGTGHDRRQKGLA